MKKKLYIVLFLTTVLLTGIIVLQLYWSFTAYKLSKEKFDGDINTAMQRALDSCKKDYFDSIRVVMVKRLSDPGTVVRMDTIKKSDTANLWIKMWLKNEQASMGEPILVSKSDLDFYRAKIKHPATNADLLAEMSFYVPRIADDVLLLLGLEDGYKQINKERRSQGRNSQKPFREVIYDTAIHSGIFAFPPNYRRADSIKLHYYFKEALQQMHPKMRRFDFDLDISDKHIPAGSFDPHLINQLRYSETDEFAYKYHGFLFLQHTDEKTLYVRAKFDRAQIGILSEMIIILGASGALIVFTILCFFYIIRTINQQRKLTELKDDFINNMTHELKTPIATITVAIEGLQKFNGLNDPEKTQRYLKTSRNELSRLDGLVSKVLNVAAFESKEVTLSKERIPIDELMNDVIEAEKQKTPKQVNISYANRDGIREIEADKLHLRNVMLNLIDNAIKYSTEPVHIEITLTENKKNAVFAIQDNGMGIPKGHIKHVFDKFHRVPAGNVHNVKGTGLGLNYVKYIVEAHGGRIGVASELNKGSEFTVSIPIKNG
jgi:signal transduction histidine kinase